MNISTRFSDSIHILAFIEIYKGKIPLTSTNIASSIETSPVVVRRLMSKLKKGKLLQTIHGSADPKLARDPKDISLYDIYLVVEGEKPLFTIDEKTNQDCIVGGNIQSTLKQYYGLAEQAAAAKLASISLADVLDTIRVKQARKQASQNKKGE